LPFKEVWRVKIPQTIKIFLYLFLQDRILTKEVLHRRNIFAPAACVLCTATQLETGTHLFFYCRYAVRAWARLERLAGCNLIRMGDTVQEVWTNSVQHLRLKGELTYNRGVILIMSLCWHLWTSRNNRIFKSNLCPPEITVERALSVAY
jgi:hypothetical protein